VVGIENAKLIVHEVYSSEVREIGWILRG